jgi:N-acylneuraminate cytidylyltransferase
MIDGKHVLAIVPARGGSKGVPRKNLRLLGGKPLIAWTIECARQSSYIDRIILSSEDDEIMQVAAALGCDVPFRRPMDLATDDAGGMAVVDHALRMIAGGEIIVLLQPTSPLRLPSDIDGCVEALRSGDAPACVSVVSVQHPPEHMYTLRPDRVMLRASDREVPARRQDLPDYVAINGAVYAADRGTLLAESTFVVPGVLGYRMPRERSIDIDAEEDWRHAGWLLECRDGKRGVL